MVKRYDVFTQDLYPSPDGEFVSFEDYAALQQKLDALEPKPETPSPLKVELPEVEKWRSMDQVRAQMAYRELVEKALAADGFEVKS